MSKIVMLVIGCAVWLTVTPALAAPSFDCAKAKTDAEHWICDDEGPPAGSDIKWFDRQIARLYRAVLDKIGDDAEAQDNLRRSQQGFMAAREACAHTYIDCMIGLHKERLRILARQLLSGAEYAELVRVEDGKSSGGMKFVRIGDRISVSIDALSTWGNGGNYCGFEADELKIGADRKFTWSGRSPLEPGESGPVCRISFVKHATEIEVKSDGCYETHFSCGNNAWISGVYKLQP